MSSALRGALLALAAYALYSSHDIIAKILGGYYSPFQIVFFTAVFGLSFLSLAMLFDKKGGALFPRQPRWVALRAFAGIGSSLFAFYAFAHMPMAQAYAILFATPLIITLLSIPVLGERVGTHRSAAVVLGLIGVLVVLRPGSAPLSLAHLAAVGAAICGATTSIVARKVGETERPATLVLTLFMAQVLAMGALMPLTYRPMPLEHLVLLAAMGAFGTVAATFVVMAYRHAAASIVAPMQYSQLLWAVFYGWILFKEGIDLWTAIGAAVIIGSGLYILRREMKPNLQSVESSKTFASPLANPQGGG